MKGGHPAPDSKFFFVFFCALSEEERSPLEARTLKLSQSLFYKYFVIIIISIIIIIMMIIDC